MKPIEEMSFEEALIELEELVNDLDSGNVPLEKSVVLYERGERLKTHCESKLKAAEMKIQEITNSGSGVSAKPADDLKE